MNNTDYFNAALQWAKSKAMTSEDVIQELAIIAKQGFIKGTSINISKRKASQKIINAVWRWSELDKADDYLSVDKTDSLAIAELFVHMVVMKAYALRRNDDHIQHTNTHPYWLFSAVTDGRTPEECVRLNSTIKKFDDPFWTRHPVPCGKPFCRCTVISLSERQALSKKI